MKIDYESLDQCILCSSKNIRLYRSEINLSVCNDCGLIFDNPRPTLASIQHYYSQRGKYDTWLEREPVLMRQWDMMLTRILRWIQSGRLLDVGAGIGFFLSLARQHFEVEGTELSSEAVRLALEKFDLSLINSELEKIKFDQPFDIITMFHVLEHLPYPNKTIEYCRTLLKSGGLLYIAVPNEPFYSLRRLLPALFSALGFNKFRSFHRCGFRKIDFSELDELHLSHFSEPILKNYLKNNGFTIIDSNMDPIDAFMFRRGLLQYLRWFIYALSYGFRFLTRLNTYNSLWVVAKRDD